MCVLFVCFVLFCFVLFCFVLFCFVLFCFVLFCFVLFCFVLLFVVVCCCLLVFLYVCAHLCACVLTATQYFPRTRHDRRTKFVSDVSEFSSSSESLACGSKEKAMFYLTMLLCCFGSVQSNIDEEKHTSEELDAAYEKIASLIAENVNLKEELALCVQGLWCP